MLSTSVSQLQRQPSTLVELPTSAPVEPDCQAATVMTADLLSVMFERFWGRLFPAKGSLLLDHCGQLTLSTPKARELCRAMQSEAQRENAVIGENTEVFTLPSCITTLCTLLINSLDTISAQKPLLQEELLGNDGLRIHLKAEWIELEGSTAQYILVTLEDVTQLAHQRSRCDAYRYHFTARETEVWTLYLQGFAYREIGNRLFIAVSTVKKHMKSIYSKQRGQSLLAALS